MRSLYLWGSALGATLASAQYVKRLNFNSSSPLSSPSTSTPPSPGLTLSVLDSTLTRPTTSWTSSSSSSLSSASSTSSTSTTSATSPAGPSRIKHPPSLLSTTNVTSLATSNGTAPAPTLCTGCVLEAYFPLSFWYREEDHSTTWTSIVVTETVLILTITYMQGSAIDTIITTRETLNQTKTVVGTANQTITHTTRSFTQPVDNTILTFAEGPTYVAYTSLFGGLDFTVGTDIDIFTTIAEPTCARDVRQLYFPSIQPTRTEDWSAFIQTITGKAPDPDDMTTPFPLPPALLQRLKQDPDVRRVFNGSDIDTCTQHPSTTSLETFHPPGPTSTVGEISLTGPPTTETSTFLSTTYQSTSTHVTRQGCLRCDTTMPLIGPPIIQTQNNPIHSQNNPNPSQVKPNDDTHTQKPDKQPPANDPGQTITIGDSVVTIHPAQPTQSDQQNPGVVIGSQTLTAGQTTIINGITVIVPSGDGSTIVVGDSTIAVNPAPTGPSVLTVGDNTLTANPQGQFIVGTQTLIPGGPAITVDGSTLSLGPSGTIAVVDGVTQTLGHAPVVTGAPVITVGGQPVTATLIGGTTQFVLGPGQTLVPGGVLTIDGTTFSMPWGSSGSTIVINGVTSTLDSPGLPIITLNNRIITASVQGGTTAFVLGPDKTLYPGGVLTVSGTTYSMPFSASGSVVVINGVTTTLGQVITAAPLLTLNGKTYTATTRDGTTEYVISPGVTLRPGDVVTIDGTTYSLDPKGTALIINGETSSIRTAPASNSATTTKTATTSSSISKSTSTSDTSSESSSQSSTSERAPANFIASGIGISKTGGAATGRRTGLDVWVESLVVGVAGWLMFLL